MTGPDHLDSAAAEAKATDAAEWRLSVLPTPDDGQRLTGHDLWDESLRPGAGPAPAEFVYSRRGEAVAGHLIEVHDMLRAELGALRDVVERVERGETGAAEARGVVNELTMRQHDWALGAYCANYCRLVSGHHSLEDAAIFPHLRSSDAGLVPVVDRLEDEHRVIHGVVEQVDRALVAYLQDGSDLSAIRHAVDLLTDTLLSHLAYEEREILEPLARFGFFPGQV